MTNKNKSTNINISKFFNIDVATLSRYSKHKDIAYQNRLKAFKMFYKAVVSDETIVIDGKKYVCVDEVAKDE